MKKICSSVLILVLISSASRLAYSFETRTHSALSERAVTFSKLDNFLKSQLGLATGIDTNLLDGTTTRTVTRWVAEGSVREDDWSRYFNHFHDPLRAWNQAGLSLVGGESSALWGQNLGQGYAWKNARDTYFNGLTSPDKAQREQLLAQTFRTLGQLIHLIQDAAVPAHTRNDPHPPWNKDGLERFALEITETSLFSQLTQAPIGFNPIILGLPQNSFAPIPIARITDTTDPEQADAVPSAINQGLAEYSNANFLSRNTIFKDFTFPRIESLDLANLITSYNSKVWK
jgi:hypothetical protein